MHADGHGRTALNLVQFQPTNIAVAALIDDIDIVARGAFEEDKIIFAQFQLHHRLGHGQLADLFLLSASPPG